MTFDELQHDTHQRLREADTSGIYFSRDDIRDAVNAGYMELSDATEWFEESLHVSLLPRRPYYDLFSIIGRVFLSVKPAFDVESNRWLVPSTVRALDHHDRRWERVDGRPQRIWMRGLRWMGLFPRINADDPDIVKLSYTRLPAPLCDGDDEPGFPEAFHVGCAHFALTELFASDGETELALKSWQDYLAIEAGLTAWVYGRTRRPLTRVFGGSP